MKFLKADGTVDEGEPLTDEQSRLRDAMEQYLHRVVCKGYYHAGYEGHPKCQKAANFLSRSVGVNDKSDAMVADSILAEIEAMKPKPQPEDEHPSLAPTGVEA